MTTQTEKKRLANHREMLQKKARRRADPNHPCHTYPDELIYSTCDRMITAALGNGKATIEREDIYTELLCPNDNQRLFRKGVTSRVKKYLKLMISSYLDPRYTVVFGEKRRRVWDISIKQEIIPEEQWIATGE
jgi:hypothetical protein